MQTITDLITKSRYFPYEVEPTEYYIVIKGRAGCYYAFIEATGDTVKMSLQISAPPKTVLEVPIGAIPRTIQMFENMVRDYESNNKR